MWERRRARPALGLVFVAAGLVPYLAASGVLPSDDSDFGVPRWALAWIVVVCFVVPGLMVLAGVEADEAGRVRAPRAGAAGPAASALLAGGLAAHAGAHALSRAGLVQAAWLGLAAVMAMVAMLYARRLARVIAATRGS